MLLAVDKTRYKAVFAQLGCPVYRHNRLKITGTFNQSKTVKAKSILFFLEESVYLVVFPERKKIKKDKKNRAFFILVL